MSLAKVFILFTLVYANLKGIRNEEIVANVTRSEFEIMAKQLQMLQQKLDLLESRSNADIDERLMKKLNEHEKKLDLMGALKNQNTET